MKLLKLLLILKIIFPVAGFTAIGIIFIMEEGKDSFSADNIWLVVAFFFPLILCLTIYSLVLLFKSIRNRKDKRCCKGLQASLLVQPSFSQAKFISNYKKRFVFAIDSRNRKVAHVAERDRQVWSYEDIISVELIDTNVTVFSKSTGRIIGGAVLGGIFGGESGSVIGALSGDYKKKDLHKSVEIKILLRDVNNPSVIINCMNLRKPVKENNKTYRKAIAYATDIADTLKVIIDDVDAAYKKAALRQTDSTSFSITDELAKLLALKKSGAISEPEFCDMKSQLLGLAATSFMNNAAVSEYQVT